MGSINSRPLTDALDDIKNGLSSRYQDDLKSETTFNQSRDSGCHLDDPRSPSCDIVRTPIHVGQTRLVHVTNVAASDDLAWFDPRSPGVPRTPIYPCRVDEEEEEIDTDVMRSFLDTTPNFAVPSDASTPLCGAVVDCADELQRSLSDPNISGEDKYLINGFTPTGRSKAVNCIRRSMKRAKKLVTKQRSTEDASPGKSPGRGLRAVDVNSPLAFIQRKQSDKIVSLSRRHSIASPYMIESSDKENAPYS